MTTSWTAPTTSRSGSTMWSRLSRLRLAMPYPSSCGERHADRLALAKINAVTATGTPTGTGRPATERGNSLWPPTAGSLIGRRCMPPAELLPRRLSE